jgi:hypothetical protein
MPTEPLASFDERTTTSGDAYSTLWGENLGQNLAQAWLIGWGEPICWAGSMEEK